VLSPFDMVSNVTEDRRAVSKMAKFTYATKEEIPETLRDAAKELADGKGFEVQVVPVSKLNEFRENNTQLIKTRDTLSEAVTKIDGVIGKKDDGTEYTLDEKLQLIQALKETTQQVKDGKLQAKTDIETELTKRTEEMRKKGESELNAAKTQLTKFKQEAEQARAEVNRLLIEAQVTPVLADEKIGLQPAALFDVQQRAARVMRVDPKEGVVIVDDSGAIVRGEDGIKPMTAKEWINTLRDIAPHYFKGSVGGGANQSAGFGGMSSTEMAKLTPMQRLELANQQAAKERNKRAR